MSDGIVDAIATWFDLHLDSHTSISTAPSWDLSWEQALFPVQVRDTLLLLPYGSLLELMAETSLQRKYWFDVIGLSHNPGDLHVLHCVLSLKIVYPDAGKPRG